MRTVTSSDGTTIAYDRSGAGPAVILVGGALSHRRFKKMVALAQLLSERCTVINYDRRGRGDSDEAGPFAVQREVEDIAALIDAAGGRASLWGWSSGGALVLRAAVADIGVQRLSVYEAPFMVDHDGKLPTDDYSQRLDELVAAGDRSSAVKHFMRNAVRLPAPLVALMPLIPMWKALKANALTLPYDWAAAEAVWLAANQPPHRPTEPRLLLTLLVGASLLGSGQGSWRTRPDNRLGPLMVLTGFAWCAGQLSEASSPLLYTAGATVQYVFIVGFVYLLLSFPSGRLTLSSPPGRGSTVRAEIRCA